MQLSEIKVGGTYYDYSGTETVTVQEIDTDFMRFNCINVIGESGADYWVHHADLMIEKPDAEAQVKRGAAKLDQVNRGWYWDISIDKLRMYMWDTCILGQLYGSFGAGETALKLGNKDAEYFGFFRENDDYEELHNLWVAEIEGRRDGEIEIP